MNPIDSCRVCGTEKKYDNIERLLKIDDIYAVARHQFLISFRPSSRLDHQFDRKYTIIGCRRPDYR